MISARRVPFWPATSATFALLGIALCSSGRRDRQTSRRSSSELLGAALYGATRVVVASLLERIPSFASSVSDVYGRSQEVPGTAVWVLTLAIAIPERSSSGEASCSRSCRTSRRPRSVSVSPGWATWPPTRSFGTSRSWRPRSWAVRSGPCSDRSATSGPPWRATSCGRASCSCGRRERRVARCPRGLPVHGGAERLGAGFVLRRGNDEAGRSPLHAARVRVFGRPSLVHDLTEIGEDPSLEGGSLGGRARPPWGLGGGVHRHGETVRRARPEHVGRRRGRCHVDRSSDGRVQPEERALLRGLRDRCQAGAVRLGSAGSGLRRHRARANGPGRLRRRAGGEEPLGGDVDVPRHLPQVRQGRRPARRGAARGATAPRRGRGRGLELDRRPRPRRGPDAVAGRRARTLRRAPRRDPRARDRGPRRACGAHSGRGIVVARPGHGGRHAAGHGVDLPARRARERGQDCP